MANSKLHSELRNTPPGIGDQEIEYRWTHKPSGRTGFSMQRFLSRLHLRALIAKWNAGKVWSYEEIGPSTDAEPRTYEQFIERGMQMQRDYIAKEVKRNAALLQLWYDYKAKAHAIAFHPLGRSEIIARSDELRMMLARIDETHGDNPCLRSLWERRLK